MTISLNRSKILIIAIITVFAYLTLNRMDKIRKSSITSGKVSGLEIRKSRWNKGEDRAAVIQFVYNGDTIFFVAEQNVQYELGEEVKVIYNNDNPEKAKVYSFAGFWLAPTLYCIIPLWLLSALILSLMGNNDKLVFKAGKGLRISKQAKELTKIEKADDKNDILLKF